MSLTDRAFRGYDRWRTAEPPWYNDDEPIHEHCTACGAFLPLRPDRTEPWDDGFDCDGERDPEFGLTQCGDDGAHAPHRHVCWGGTYEYRDCRRCATTNKETVA